MNYLITINDNMYPMFASSLFTHTVTISAPVVPLLSRRTSTALHYKFMRSLSAPPLGAEKRAFSVNSQVAVGARIEISRSFCLLQV